MKRTSVLPLLLVAAGLSSCVMPVPSRPPEEREGLAPPPPRRILPPATGANRPAKGLWEIDRVAQRVARATGKPLVVTVQENPESRSPVASMYHRVNGGRIVLNPRAARRIPLNAWAFIFGHEFAHHVHRFGNRGHTDPEQELRADILGAEYAMAAGYELVPYLRWMLANSGAYTRSHGSMHERAFAVARHFGVSREL
jgi:hypothetical protein